MQQHSKPHDKTKMILTPEKMKIWRLRICNELSPALAEALTPSTLFTQGVCDDINKLFNALALITPTVGMLKNTKIHVALQSICEPGGGWPTGMSKRAEHLLEKWEDEINELAISSDIVWSEDGVLAGCTEIRSKDRSGWVIEMKDGKPRETALATGDFGFKPRKWWVNRAAAVRDGMINSLDKDITWDIKGAYAVIVTGDREKGSSPHIFRYDRTGVEGAFRMLVRMTSMPNRVRVLREHTSKSPYAPQAGLRYEGIYRISHFSTKLEFNEDGSNKWIWISQFEREAREDTEDGPLRLVRPDAEDMRVWQKYVIEREEHVKQLQDVKGSENEGTFVFWESYKTIHFKKTQV